MNNLPNVNIAMPVYNAADTIECAIKSILWQTHNNWKLYIIDDGSTDGTLDIVKKYADDRINLYSDGKRLGLAERLNQIINVCEGSYMARLDSDDIAYPNRLELQVRYLELHPEVDLLGTGALMFDSNGLAYSEYPVRIDHSDICRNPWSGFYLAHPTWMGRTSWFRKHHYLANMRKAQDQDLLLRTYTSSVFHTLPDILVGYRKDKPELKNTLTSRYYFSMCLMREASRQSNYLALVFAPCLQILKGITDTITIPTGLKMLFNKLNKTSIQQDKLDAWNTVWSLCKAEDQQ